MEIKNIEIENILIENSQLIKLLHGTYNQVSNSQNSLCFYYAQNYFELLQILKDHLDTNRLILILIELYNFIGLKLIRNSY